MTRSTAAPVVPVDVHLQPAELTAALRHDVATGLAGSPKQLPPKWFYDERGSELFEQITQLPEYYPTRREREILRARAGDVAALTGADTLVELGSGSSEKTRLLLDALQAGATLARYVPVDVSESALRSAAETIAADYPDLAVHGVVADFDRHLHLLPAGGRRLTAFLGGTIGNMRPAERVRFLTGLAATARVGDTLLLGADLVKDPARLVAAYDDSAGVTAAFNRNVLHVLARELGATLDPETFAHVARWDTDEQWIEMRLRAGSAQRVDLPALGMHVDLAEGEEILTEISAKFTRERLAAELADAGWSTMATWTDAAGDFSLTLARMVDPTD